MKFNRKGIYLCFLLVFCGGAPIFAQNVGIGTPAPGNKLHVQANAAADGIQIDNIAADGDPILQYRVNGTSRITMGIDDSDADKFKIGTTALTTNTRITIQTNGYIGIGTTTPTHYLHMQGTMAGDYLAWYENLSGTGSSLVGYVTGTYNGLGGVTNNTAGLGNYGVHLPSTGSGWAMWGTSNSSDAVGVRGSIPTTGSWLGYGGLFYGGLGYANGLYNLSDRRAKTNIKDLENALDKITSMRGVTYNYSEEFKKYVGNDTRTYIGFVAQEVEQIFPEAVAEKNISGIGQNEVGATFDMNNVMTEKVKVVDYVAIVPVLVEAIKEQQKQIEELQKKLDQLGK